MPKKFLIKRHCARIINFKTKRKLMVIDEILASSSEVAYDIAKTVHGRDVFVEEVGTRRKPFKPPTSYRDWWMERGY